MDRPSSDKNESMKEEVGVKSPKKGKRGG